MRNPSYGAVTYFLARYKKLFASIFILSLFSSVLESLSVAAFFPLFVNLLGNDNSQTGGVLGFVGEIPGRLDYFSPLVSASLMIVGIFIVKNIFVLARDFLMAYANGKIMYNLKREMIEKYSRSEYQFFLDSQQGTLIYDNLNAPNSVANVLLNGMRIITFSFRIIFILALLIFILPYATLAIVGLGVLYFAFINFLSKHVSYQLGIGRVRALQEKTIIFNEFITGIRHVAIFNSAGDWLKRFDRQNRLYGEAVAKDRAWQSIPRPIMEVLVIGMMIGTILVLWVTLDDGFIDMVPVVGVFAVALAQLMPSLTSVGSLRMSFMASLPDTEQTYNALTRQTNKRQDGEIHLRSFNHAVAFDNLSFAHKDREPLFQHLNLTFEKGKVTALTGPSGSGKTTVLNLIMGLFEPTSGSINIDGTPLSDIKLASWRAMIGFVSQDSFNYHTTIAENIRFGRNQFSDESVIDAAKFANAHGFISELPQGYETIVGDRGMTLSGGQQQRLAIARAILDSPEILILDEATSSLDSRSETLVQEALDNASVNRTVIVVAHRFSTISNADKIIVIDDGCVVEEGLHLDLLKKSGLYAKLAEQATH